MTVNPIIPVYLMTIICIVLLIVIIYDKEFKEKVISQLNNKQTTTQNKILKKHVLNIIIKVAIVFLLFLINLRFMIPNGDVTVINSNVSVLFVIDISVSMRALDYDGNKERFEGVINDCCYIVDELSSCKFSIITFGDTAQKVIPFTTDTDMVQAELKAINLESDFYASGTSINLVNELLEDTLEKENERQNGETKFVIFFVTDGEITVEGETLESFSNISPYITSGAVMGYGTTTGGRMVNSLYADDIYSNNYYLYYYDENYNRTLAISQLDEDNLNQLASDIGVDYIHMTQTSNIDYKLREIDDIINDSLSSEDKSESYEDIYYIFAIPLVILLIIDFILKKRNLTHEQY